MAAPSNNKNLEVGNIVEDGTSSTLGLEHVNTIVNLFKRATSYIQGIGKDFLKADAVFKLSVTNDIILIGPPRVGKTTLISQLSELKGRTSASLSSCTLVVERFQTHGFTFWDTPGIESWNQKEVEAFWNDLFISRKILPMSVLIVLAPGVFMQLNKLQQFVSMIEKYSIQCIAVITKAYSIDNETLNTYYAELRKHLHWESSHEQLTATSWRVGKKSFLALVNSKTFYGVIGNGCVRFGMTELIRILINCQDLETKIGLMKMHCDNASWLEYCSSIMLDMIYIAGVPLHRILPAQTAEEFERIKKETGQMNARKFLQCILKAKDDEKTD